MTTINDFETLRHIEQIRKRLWCGREFGQAAVMVGAGFSCNAQPKQSNSPGFPLWGKLANLMYEEIYKHKPFDQEHRDESISNALELAGEYEKVFGRQLLCKFLQDSIPDRQYDSGKLHKILLSLPWSDVFTTNYDTLLERTTTHILDRKYDFIYTPYDIPGNMKPRIVKLHGSFPSHRPFTITEQDYKNYPQKFAPFVSMVQQSIMENAFCLIGFSGDDPNFKSWVKWVRDKLGDYAPPIYLCGVLNLPDKVRENLQKDNITIVDLSPIFPRSQWQNSSQRHSMALEWFLLSLMNGKEKNGINWMMPNQTNNWQSSNGIPALLQSPSCFSPLGNIDPRQ